MNLVTAWGVPREGIVLTAMEHHSNLVLGNSSASGSARRWYAPLDSATESLDVDALVKMIAETKLVAVAHVSNTLAA